MRYLKDINNSPGMWYCSLAAMTTHASKQKICIYESVDKHGASHDLKLFGFIHLNK